MYSRQDEATYMDSWWHGLRVLNCPVSSHNQGSRRCNSSSHAWHVLPNLPGKVVRILPTHSDYEPNSHTHGKVLNSLQEGLQGSSDAVILWFEHLMSTCQQSDCWLQLEVRKFLRAMRHTAAARLQHLPQGTAHFLYHLQQYRLAL